MARIRLTFDKEVGRNMNLGSVADAGTHLAMGSDWPVSTANPWEAIHVAVNRTHPDAKDLAPLLPEQALHVTTALRAYTSGSAHLLRSQTNGTIRIGTLANLALASANPFNTDPRELIDVSNELTIANGRVVHDLTTAFAGTSPATKTTAAQLGERQS